MKTFAELAGAIPPAGLDGVSVVPTLLGDTTQTRSDFLYWNTSEGFTGEANGFREAIRFGDLKATLQGGTLELFDLSGDPGEDTDVSANPAYADDVVEIMGFFNDLDTNYNHLESDNDPDWRPACAPSSSITTRPNCGTLRCVPLSAA